jgi:hypothetical protein
MGNEEWENIGKWEMKGGKNIRLAIGFERMGKRRMS